MELLIGTYSQTTGDVPGNGEGIYSVSFDADTGAFDTPRLRQECSNPSWLELSPDGRHLFSVRESFEPNDAAILSFHLDRSGNLNLTNTLSIKGDSPCHLAFDPHHQRLASAQYASGNVAIAPVIAGELKTVQYIDGSGTGPNPNRQEGPHAHFVNFTDNGDVLHIVDLGADRITSHRLSYDGAIIETTVVNTPPGSGPRHMAINKSGTRAWALCELNETLIFLLRDGFGWKVDKIQNAFTTPETRDGAAGAIRFSPDERFFYISGRHQSCIAGFDTDGNSVGEVATGGDFPRDFIVSADGNWVIVANQLGNNLTSFKRNPASGELIPTMHNCEIGSPVSVLELN